MRLALSLLRLLRDAYAGSAERAEHPVEARAYRRVTDDLSTLIAKLEERL